MPLLESYEEDVRTAKLRGLKPLLIHFTFNIRSLTLTETAPVVLMVERRKQKPRTAPIVLSPPKTFVRESLHLHAVFARRGGIDDVPENNDIIRDGVALEGFEIINVRFKVKKEGVDTVSVDSVTINLSKLIYGRKSLSTKEFEMIFGGKVEMRIEAVVLEHGENVDDVERFKFPDEEEDEDKREKKSKHDTSKEDIRSESDEEGSDENEDEKKGKSGGSAVAEHEGIPTQKLKNALSYLSFCTTDSDTDTYKEDPAQQGIQRIQSRGPLRGVCTTRTNAIREYTTLRTGGQIWSEVPVISRVETPEQLRVWSIQGPEETDDEDDDDEDEGEANRKKPSRMMVSCDKPGPKAKVGKLSPLQKVCVYMEGKSRVVDMGVPVSLQNGGKQGIRALQSEATVIDEPELSSTESDSEEEGRNMDKVLTNRVEEGEYVDDYEFSGREVKGGGFTGKVKELTEREFDKLKSVRDEDCVVGELRRQIDALSEYIRRVQIELKECEVEKIALKQKVQKLEVQVDNSDLLRELQNERRLHNISQKENERLVGVITRLEQELDKATALQAKKKKKGLFNFSPKSSSSSKENRAKNN